MTDNNLDVWKEEHREEFEELYELYVKQFRKTHGSDCTYVCYSEWCDNELLELEENYRGYLKHTVAEDESFDVFCVESFEEFAKEEIKDPMYPCLTW